MGNFDMEDIKIAYTVNKVFLVIFALCVIIGGIVISVLLDVGIGLGVLFGGGFFCALLWIFSRIIFGFFYDVKTIRNHIVTLDWNVKKLIQIAENDDCESKLVKNSNTKINAISKNAPVVQSVKIKENNRDNAVIDIDKPIDKTNIDNKSNEIKDRKNGVAHTYNNDKSAMICNICGGEMVNYGTEPILICTKCGNTINL